MPEFSVERVRQAASVSGSQLNHYFVDLAVGYDRWLTFFADGLTAMRGRDELTAEADPRHLAVALLAAHQGGALLTYVTASPEPFRAAVDAALDYVAAFVPATPKRRARMSDRSTATKSS
jgi:hypothetical protein